MNLKFLTILLICLIGILPVYTQSGGDLTDDIPVAAEEESGTAGEEENGETEDVTPVTETAVHQETITPAGDFLFINSSPIRSAVFIGGKETNMKTPCIIRGKNLNLSVITVKKEGYKDYQLSQEEIETKSAAITLIPISFDLFFPHRTNYKIGNTTTKGPVYISNLQQGNYSMKVQGNQIAFTRVSPFTPWEVFLGTATVISATGMVTTITLAEVANYNAYLNREGEEVDYEFFKRSTQNLDYAKFAFIGITSAFACALITVVAIDVHTRFKKKKDNLELSQKLPAYEDETFYESAMQFLSSGEITRSTQILFSIISMFPQSDFLPMVYYQLGQNYYILGDYDNAIKYWEIFIRDYPLQEYYDYVIKNFADIYYTQGDLVTAKNVLNRVLFTGDTINMESIYSLQAKLDFELFTSTGENDYFTGAEEKYSTLITYFANSERLDIYFLMLIKLYKSINAVDKLSKLRQKVGSLTDIDESMRKLILSYF